MPVVFLTRPAGAVMLSDEDCDALVDEVQECVEANEGIVLLPEGWGVVVSDVATDPADEYDDDDLDDEDEAMDSNEDNG